MAIKGLVHSVTTLTEEKNMEDNNANVNQSNQTNTNAGSTTANVEIDYDKLANIVGQRSANTENSVLRGYFKDQGMSPEQMNEAVKSFKETQASKKQEEANKLSQVERENAELKSQILNGQIDSKISTVATEQKVSSEKLPFLLKVIERKDLTKDGVIDEEKIKSAVEEAIKTFPEFVIKDETKGVRKIGSDGQGDSGDVDDALRAAFGLKKTGGN